MSVRLGPAIEQCQYPTCCFLGRPRGRWGISRPRRRTIFSDHEASPNGQPLLTARRRAASSASVCAVLTSFSQCLVQIWWPSTFTAPSMSPQTNRVPVSVPGFCPIASRFLSHKFNRAIAVDGKVIVPTYDGRVFVLGLA